MYCITVTFLKSRKNWEKGKTSGCSIEKPEVKKGRISKLSFVSGGGIILIYIDQNNNSISTKE